MNNLKIILQFGLFVLSLQTKAITVLTPTDTLLQVSIHHDTTLFSTHLNRALTLDIVLPPNYTKNKQVYPVLYMNDGQDLNALNMVQVLNTLYQHHTIKPFILVAIHCGERIQEYGVAAQADYKKRGAKAKLYTDFVVEELLPYINKKYSTYTDAAHNYFCGFSLGGLSAFDIVWNHPEKFSKVGVFSGSFWWRQRAYENHYDDHADRIMHRIVREHATKPPIKFWLQTGTKDEKEDRNNNGIIDSIEDTLDLIAELEKKGYKWQQDIQYVEVKDGQHNQHTWQAVMPDFLHWVLNH